jgi:hypothetical protein
MHHLEEPSLVFCLLLRLSCGVERLHKPIIIAFLEYLFFLNQNKSKNNFRSAEIIFVFFD